MEFENYKGFQRGWWWLAQILVAEAKSTKSKKAYENYCNDFVEYLEALGPPPDKERRWGSYGTR